MRIALTGATGLHGLRACWRAGGARRSRCSVLARAGGGARPPERRGATWIEGDLARRGARWRAWSEGADAVVHVAAVYRTAGHPDAYYREVNVGGTERLLEAAARRRAPLRPHLDGRRARRTWSDPPADETAPHGAGRHLPGDQGRGRAAGACLRPRARRCRSWSSGPAPSTAPARRGC